MFCQSEEHKRYACPLNKYNKADKKQTKQAGLLQCHKVDYDANRFVIPIHSLGMAEQTFTGYVDTGCMHTIANSKIVPDTAYTGNTLAVRGLFSPEIHIPLARISVKSPKFKTNGYVSLEVGVVNTSLPRECDLLIGAEVFDEISKVVFVSEPDRDGIVDQTEKTENKAALCNVKCNMLEDAIKSGEQDSELVEGRVNSNEATEPVAVVTRRQSSKGGKIAIPHTHAQSVVTTNDKTLVRSDGVNMTTPYWQDGSNSNKNPTADVVEVIPISSEGQLRYEVDRNEGKEQHRQAKFDSLGLEGRKSQQQEGVMVDKDDISIANVEFNDSGYEEFERLAKIDPTVLKSKFIDSSCKRNAFVELQRNDEKLRSAWKKADLRQGGFVIMPHSGLLIKRKIRPDVDETDFQIVLPDCKKREVLIASHDSEISGNYCGFKRTYQKISRNFYIPRREVKKYVRSCTVCQRMRPKTINERAEYIVPMIEAEWGSTWVCDVLGPQLPRTTRSVGNYSHILVCVEMSTRWVELIPLASLKANSLATAIETTLLARFSCKTLVYDMQSGLMSELMQSVLKLLRVKSHIAVAAYHARTALAERYIQTVEKFLKPYLETYKGKWALLLPWIAFQLRQTPCASLHYSAHELCFGKNFPDYLDDLKDDILDKTNSEERALKTNVLTYMTDLRERLSISREVACKNATEQSERTKSWYDKHCSKNKSFAEGQKVLILIPTDTQKLYAKWSEPAVVIKQVGHRNYVVRTSEGTDRTYHVNQLRAFNERTEFVAALVVATDRQVNEEDSFISVIDDDKVDKPKFNIEASLPNEQKQSIDDLLMEFSDVFSDKLGCTDLAVHSIVLTDQTPCVSKTYSIAESLKKPLGEEIDRLLEAGILRPCSSAYRAPLIPLLKADKVSLRLVNNYQKLNAVTQDDLYPMPNPMEIVRKAAGKRFVSKIDLSKAFYQIRLSKESQEYTAFWTPEHGCLCWTRCCQGLENSPQTRSRLMCNLLRRLSSFCGCLLDDIVISSDDFESHISHLRTVLTRLREANLTASIAKSQFLMKSLDVLGYCLEDGVITPLVKHIEAVSKIGPQKTKAGVRAILGILGYHRNMIPNFAEISYPLTELLNKNEPDRNINWQQKHTDAVEEIKRILSSKPVLVAPRHDQDYIIMSDATDRTIAGILAQKDDDGIERNVAYFSRKLLPNEINYSVMEKEALGILASCLKFNDFIYGHKVLARTDHRCLEFLDSTSQHNARIARWKVILSNYDLVTQYRKGSLHSNCDGLSRIEM